MDKDRTVINIETKQKSPSWLANAVSTITHRVSSSLFGISKDGKRNINDIFGYTEDLTFADSYSMWRRGGIAQRIVNSVARSCWRDGVSVINNEKPVHEDALQIMNKHGKLFKRLEQADVLNRIGRYSVLFVGIPDGLDFDKPLGKAKPDRLKEIYFRAYGEDGIEIVKWITDPTDPKYGMPEVYQLQRGAQTEGDIGVVSQPIKVHHTRILHMAEGSLDNDAEGISALEAVYNTLEDIVKTAGGAAEAFFRNARNRFSMETDPKYATSFGPAEKEQLEEEAIRFQNEWQDFIRAGGINIKPLQITQHSPADTFMCQVKILSGTTGLPMRVLIGEGAGQYAGNEDKESLNQIIQDRRDLWCTEWVMDVLVIVSNAGMIELADDDEIFWEVVGAVSGKEKAVTAKENSAALSNMASALSQPAIDGLIEVEDGIRLIFGEQALAQITIQQDDDLDDDDLDDDDLDDDGDDDDDDDDDDDE